VERSYPLWKPASATSPRSLDALREAAAKIMAQRGFADTGTTSPGLPNIIPPEAIPQFVRDFPAYEVFEKVPSNGVSHTYLAWTAFSQSDEPHTVAENGNVQPDRNSYLRRSTNIAQVALERGITIKAQLLGQQLGAFGGDPLAGEIRGGLYTIARDYQKLFLRYQEANPGASTVTAADGKFNGDGVNGLRYIANNFAPPENTQVVDISSGPWDDQRVLLAFREVASAIWDKGGRVDMAMAGTKGLNALVKDQIALTRYNKVEDMQITPGLRVKAIETDQGLCPILPIPGTGMGTWTDGVHTYQDIFVLVSETFEIPYIGAPEPAVIRVPLGTNGLNEVAIPFALLGFNSNAPQWVGRVTLKLT
jgi:hypothetical protein